MSVHVPQSKRTRGISLSGSHAPWLINCNPDRRREATQGRLAISRSSAHFTLTLTRLPHSFGSAEHPLSLHQTSLYTTTRNIPSRHQQQASRGLTPSIHPPKHVAGDHLWANSTADVAPPSCMLPAASTWPRQRQRPTTATDSLRYPWAPTPATLRPPLSTRTRTRDPRALTWR